MYCPHCSTYLNYKFIRCPKCYKHTFNEEKNNEETFASMDLTYLTTACSEIEANMLQELLHSHNIQSVKKYREAGGILSIYMGDTSFGIDLYVDKEQLPIAKMVISNIRNLENKGKNRPNTKNERQYLKKHY